MFKNTAPGAFDFEALLVGETVAFEIPQRLRRTCHTNCLDNAALLDVDFERLLVRYVAHCACQTSRIDILQRLPGRCDTKFRANILLFLCKR